MEKNDSNPLNYLRSPLHHNDGRLYFIVKLSSLVLTYKYQNEMVNSTGN